MADGGTILLTAFEPSGDALGAAFVASIRRLRPDLNVMALGGPAMAEAGATLIETTTERAVMLHGAAAQAMQHRARVARLRDWLRTHRIDALVPIDSPAANWSICAAVRDVHPRARIVHLVAPQLWAWAPWRIRKMRRLSDHVLCLLPFEPDWFSARGVAATFVGHPLFDEPPRPERGELQVEGQLVTGAPRLALLPGSRPGEIAKNFPTMLAVWRALQVRHPEMAAVVAAREGQAADQVRGMIGSDPARRLVIATGQTPAVLRWSDVVLVVSGTATLQVAAVPRPMVAMFNVNRLAWSLVGRWLIQTRTFTLPNLIAQWQGQSHIVPEFVPHFGQVDPLVEAVDRLLVDDGARDGQLASLRHVGEAFADVRFADAAPAAMLSATGL